MLLDEASCHHLIMFPPSILWTVLFFRYRRDDEWMTPANESGSLLPNENRK